MNLSKETIAEKSIELVIMDAIEKGFIKTSADMQAYMQSEVFENACLSYMTMFEEEFNGVTGA